MGFCGRAEEPCVLPGQNELPPESVLAEHVSSHHDRACNTFLAYWWDTRRPPNQSTESRWTILCLSLSSKHKRFDVNHESFVRPDQFDMEDAPGAFSRLPMLRPEQKSILFMSFVIRKFTKGSDIVLDPFTGTGATPKACLLDQRHLNCTGCDADSVCVVKMMLSLSHVIAKHVINL